MICRDYARKEYAQTCHKSISAAGNERTLVRLVKENRLYPVPLAIGDFASKCKVSVCIFNLEVVL